MKRVGAKKRRAKKPDPLIQTYKRIEWLQRELASEMESYRFIYAHRPKSRVKLLDYVAKQPTACSCYHID